MINQTKKVASADIVVLSGFRSGGSRKRSPAFRDIAATDNLESATLLSVRQQLVHRATIGLEDIDAVHSQYSVELAEELMASLRHFLNQEFGHLRVHRYRQALTVSHHCLETLIAGLLRVQFHSRQLEFAGALNNTESQESVVPAVIWGVGESVVEAENERLKRRRLSRS